MKTSPLTTTAPTPLSGAMLATTPPISADWGIAVAVLIIGLAAVWRWAQAKDSNEDGLHQARLLDYQSRERLALERETVLRQYLVQQAKAITALAETHRALLHEVRTLRSQQEQLLSKAEERMGKIQREGAIVMAQANSHYKDLSDRVLLLAKSLESIEPFPYIRKPKP